MLSIMFESAYRERINIIKIFPARGRFERAPFDLFVKTNNGGEAMKYLLLVYMEENH